MAVPDYPERRIDESQILHMRDSMIHRGPDDAGVLVGDNFGLGHRRLSIVDVAGGHQPMSNEDNTVWLSFNGEIYNHRSIRSTLEDLGHQYRTQSDTETIIHLYEEAGREAVKQLRGMFAFAIWDTKNKTLLLARDRLGIKPLYYAMGPDGSISFSSEIKGLIQSGAVKPLLNYNALPDYAANRHTAGVDTLFEGVKRLLPGHTLTWKNGKVEIEQYWDLSFSKEEEDLGDETYVRRFYELLQESVRLRLMADVPLGMFLSGGIDSSAIAAIMSQMKPEGFKTFSVGFEERDANELGYARLVANALGSSHYEVTVSPGLFFATLPSLVYHEDEPLAHPSSVPLYFVSELAAGHVKVVLTGEGSDELLAGFGKYRKTIYNLKLGQTYHQTLPRYVTHAVSRAVVLMNGKSLTRGKLARSFLCVPPNVDDMYFDCFSVFPRSMQAHLFSHETHQRISSPDPYQEYRNLMSQADGQSLLDKLLAVDIKTYLQELLMKQDQMSMATSIESRVPFLDHKLVEFAAKLPERMKLSGLTTKRILRSAMAARLPRAILTRRKMGFPVPLGSWLRGPFTHLLDEYVLGGRARARDIFNHDFVDRLVAGHRAGEDHAERLWALINFEIWQRHFIDGERIDNVAERYSLAHVHATAPASKGAYR